MDTEANSGVHNLRTTDTYTDLQVQVTGAVIHQTKLLNQWRLFTKFLLCS